MTLPQDASIRKIGEERARELSLTVRKVTYEHDEKDRGYQGRYSGMVYDADDVHAVLGKGVEVKGNNDRADWYMRDYNLGHEYDNRALLIGVRPLVAETREQKLEQLLGELADGKFSQGWKELQQRARKLLEREGVARR